MEPARRALSIGRLLTFNRSGIDFQTVWISHFRDEERNEVDIVIENRRAMVAGVEVKGSATVTGSDFGGLQRLAVPFGERLFAAPISTL